MNNNFWAYNAGMCWGFFGAGIGTQLDLGVMPLWLIAALFAGFVVCTFMANRPARLNPKDQRHG